MTLTLRKDTSSRRSDRTIGRLVFAGFLGLGMSVGVGLGNLAIHQSTKRAMDHAAQTGSESALELNLALSERTRALQVLASLPLRELSSAGGPLDRFKAL